MDNSVAGGPFTLTVGGNNQSSTFGGVIKNSSGALARLKVGTGTVILGGPNTNTGNTTISVGKLLINGSTAGGSLTVQSGATLGGTASVSGNVHLNSGGHLSPGASPGIFNSGILNLASGGNFDVELNEAIIGTQYDQQNVTGNVTLAGAVLNFSRLYPADRDAIHHHQQ